MDNLDCNCIGYNTCDVCSPPNGERMMTDKAVIQSKLMEEFVEWMDVRFEEMDEASRDKGSNLAARLVNEHCVDEMGTQMCCPEYLALKALVEEKKDKPHNPFYHPPKEKKQTLANWAGEQQELIYLTPVDVINLISEYLEDNTK